MALLFALPLVYMVVVYLGSLVALMINSFYQLDDFSGKVVQEFSLENYAALLQPGNLSIILRTATMAAAVTVACAVLAFPLAYYMARYASPRAKGWLYLAVLLPLWSSFVVRVYAWKLILARRGGRRLVRRPVRRSVAPRGGSEDPGHRRPLAVGFLPGDVHRLRLCLAAVHGAARPGRVGEAAEILPGGLRRFGGAAWRDVPQRHPAALLPGSRGGLDLHFFADAGRFRGAVGAGNSSFFIGQAVLAYQGTAGNLPLAAAMTVVPMIIMIAYLLVAKRLGAFEAL